MINCTVNFKILLWLRNWLNSQRNCTNPLKPLLILHYSLKTG